MCAHMLVNTGSEGRRYIILILDQPIDKLSAIIILNTNKTIDKKSSHNPYMQDYARFFV